MGKSEVLLELLALFCFICSGVWSLIHSFIKHQYLSESGPEMDTAEQEMSQEQWRDDSVGKVLAAQA